MDDGVIRNLKRFKTWGTGFPHTVYVKLILYLFKFHSYPYLPHISQSYYLIH